MSYLLDANACIQYLNGRSEHLRKQLSNKRPEEIVLCSVVKAELFFGAQKSLKPERNLKEIRKFSNDLHPFLSMTLLQKTMAEFALNWKNQVHQSVQTIFLLQRLLLPIR